MLATDPQCLHPSSWICYQSDGHLETDRSLHERATCLLSMDSESDYVVLGTVCTSPYRFGPTAQTRPHATRSVKHGFPLGLLRFLIGVYGVPRYLLVANVATKVVR